MSYPKVSIIILNWNGLEDTIECLESLQKINYPNYEVIVVDNGSRGNDAQVLQEKFGDYVHLIKNDKNYGFAKGNNIGIRYAFDNPSSEYFLLLNNDTAVAPNFLAELIKAARSDASIGIVGPKIYYYDFEGRNNVIWFAGGKISWYRLNVFYHIGLRDGDLPKYQTIASVDWITGSAMMFKRQVIENLSLLNVQYFFGIEDVEYCLKARKHGFSVVYVPTARVWHKVSASAKRYNPTLTDLSPYYYFIRQNFSPLVYAYQLLILPVRLFQWAIAYVLKYRDKETLVRFLFNFKNFVLKRR